MTGLDWQIGSKTPPTVCLCCGFRFDNDKRKRMGPYFKSPYIWVCKDCHDKPFLFFSDKRITKDGLVVSDGMLDQFVEANET